MQVGPGTSCTIITGSAKPEPKAQVQSGDGPSKLSTIKPVSVAPVRSQQSQGECKHFTLHHTDRGNTLSRYKKIHKDMMKNMILWRKVTKTHNNKPSYIIIFTTPLE